MHLPCPNTGQLHRHCLALLPLVAATRQSQVGGDVGHLHRSHGLRLQHHLPGCRARHVPTGERCSASHEPTYIVVLTRGSTPSIMLRPSRAWFMHMMDYVSVVRHVRRVDALRRLGVDLPGATHDAGQVKDLANSNPNPNPNPPNPNRLR